MFKMEFTRARTSVSPLTPLKECIASQSDMMMKKKKKIYNAHIVEHYKHKSEARAVARWPDGDVIELGYEVRLEVALETV